MEGLNDQAGLAEKEAQAAAFMQQLAELEKTDPEEFKRLMGLLEQQAALAAQQQQQAAQGGRGTASGAPGGALRKGLSSGTCKGLTA
jgi:hypothetical protein